MKKQLNCPFCNNYIGQWDGRSKMPISTICRKCYHFVSYNPENGQTKIKNRPDRLTASGTRIW